MSTRCDELQSLTKRGCDEAMIESPHGEQKVLRNQTVTNRRKGAEKLKPEDITQIQPQKLVLTLRSGENMLKSVTAMLGQSLFFTILTSCR